MNLDEALALPRGMTAFVGGGGKTTLIRKLAEELSRTARVLIATTTKMWPPDCDTLISPTRRQIAEALTATRLLAVGDRTPEGKLTGTAALGGGGTELADYVLIEADGSRGLPLKAPAEHEPVLPQGASLVVAVAGMSCAGLTVREAAHRPERYAALAGLNETDVVTPEAVARVLCHPQGQRKGVAARFTVALNQADTPQRLDFARDVARRLPCEAVILALHSADGVLEHWREGRLVQA